MKSKKNETLQIRVQTLVTFEAVKKSNRGISETVTSDTTTTTFPTSTITFPTGRKP